MYCTKCGTKNDEGKEFCKKCGAQVSSGKSGINVSIPDTITIDTSIIQKLSKYQKMYYGGGLLTLIGSFLPWGNVNIGFGMMGSGLGNGSFSILSLGIFNIITLLYLLPLVVLGYFFYLEAMNKKSVPVYLKSCFITAFSLTTFSLTLFTFLIASQLQSFVGMAAQFGGGAGGGVFGMGIGLIFSFAGCVLVTSGILLSIREQTH